MSRLLIVAGLVCLLLAVLGQVVEPDYIEAADCGRTSVDLTPITDLTQPYMGYPGGLYLGGLNSAPAEHAAIAAARSSEIQPRRTDGSVAPDGRIVLLSLGMTMTTLEYQAFMQLADGDPQINPAVLLVDGAQDNAFAEEAASAASPSWTTVDNRLASAGATRDQVQVIWLKQATDTPQGAFPEHAEALSEQLDAIVKIAQDRFPNLQIIYLSSRIYSGYAESGRPNPQRLNPEPYAYESAFAVRWLIEKQIGGDMSLNPDAAKGPVTAPVLLWGPYMWADGTSGRSDGLTWECSDFEIDGTIPSASGQQKVANMLMSFFKTHPTAKPWFMVDQAATPIPSATPIPTNTPAPTSTPGGGRQTRQPMTRVPPTITMTPTDGPSPTPGPTNTPAPLKSYRVVEVPTGDQMWISSNNEQVQQLLENINPRRETWVCGVVQADAALEWGFRFIPASVRVPPNAPRQQRTRIGDIAADTASHEGGRYCIRVGRVTENVDGTPPPYETPDPRTPSSTPGRRTPGPRTPVPSATPSNEPGGATEIYLPIVVNA